MRGANLDTVTLAGVEAGGRWQMLERTELFSSAPFIWGWGEEEFWDGTKSPADRIPPLNSRVGMFFQDGSGANAPGVDVVAALEARL